MFSLGTVNADVEADADVAVEDGTGMADRWLPMRKTGGARVFLFSGHGTSFFCFALPALRFMPDVAKRNRS